MFKERRINKLPPELLRLLVIAGIVTGGFTILATQTDRDGKNPPGLETGVHTGVPIEAAASADCRILPPAGPGEQPVEISTETQTVIAQENDTVYEMSRPHFKENELNEVHAEVQRLNPHIDTSAISPGDAIVIPKPCQG